MSEEDGARNSGSDLMAMPELVVADDGTVSISEAERQKYQWKYAKIGAGEIKKKLEKKEEDLAKLRKKKKSDPTKDAHLVLVLEMLKEAAAKRIRCEGKLAKRSGVDGGKAPKARMFLLVVTPPYDAAAGPQWTLVPFITLEYYDSKWGAAKGIIELGCDTICTKGDGKTVTTGTGDRFTLSATTGLKIVVQVPEEEMALGKTPDGLRPYWFNCPDETTRDMWYDNVTAVIEEAKTMFEASSKIQATMRGKAERKEFVEKLAAKKSQAVGYTGEALAAAAAKGATLYAVAAPKAQEAYGAMKTQATAAHVSLEQAVAFKYASEIFMEIDFAAPRTNTKGLALGQLVQWWAATGGVQPSDEDIAAAKAIWEEKDTDGADEGEGLFVDDFCFVVHKMQDAGLLDTAWAAVEKKAAAVGKSWGSCTAASLTVGTAAVYGGAAKASGKANGYLKKAKASAASAVTGSAVYAKAKPKAMAAYDEMHTAAKVRCLQLQRRPLAVLLFPGLRPNRQLPYMDPVPRDSNSTSAWTIDRTQSTRWRCSWRSTSRANATPGMAWRIAS
jgi:hypothetical protein